MSGFYDAIDVFFSYEGDYHIDHKGDLQDTSFDYLRSIHQYIINVVRSDRGAWKLRQELGADLSSFVGMPNTKEVGNAIKERLTSALLEHNQIKTNDLTVKVIPLSKSSIAVRVEVSVTPTRNNSQANKLTLNFMYDYADNNVFPIRGHYNIK